MNRYIFIQITSVASSPPPRLGQEAPERAVLPMDQGTPGDMNNEDLRGGDRKHNGDKKDEPPVPPSGQKHRKLQKAGRVLPVVTLLTNCKLRLLKLERIKDYLLMEDEFVSYQEQYLFKEFLSYQEQHLEEEFVSYEEEDLEPWMGEEEDLEPWMGEEEHLEPWMGEEEIVSNQGEEFSNLSNQEHQIITQEDKNFHEHLVDFLRGSPMIVGELEQLIGEKHAIVFLSARREWYYVGILSIVDKNQLEPGCKVLMCHPSLHVVGIIHEEEEEDGDDIDLVMLSSLTKLADEAPSSESSYADIGGLDAQIQEIREAVELPLTHPELYDDIGIKPPKCVILYGKPGTGKTLLARAVANSTSATFLRLVGSELVQKDAGAGSKLLRRLFRMASDLSPSIVFIDEIDAVGTKRSSYINALSGGEREVQRTMLELLNQLDGFDGRGGDVKVILATNRIESLDPALLRPGRIDRKIELPLPDVKKRRHIFQIHTSRMALADDVNLEECVVSNKGGGGGDFSGADIKAICTEAGLLALRERRTKVTHADFKEAMEKKVMLKENEGFPEGLYI